MKIKFPPLAVVPPPSIQRRIPSEDWAACLDAWIASIQFRLRVSEGDFSSLAAEDAQAQSFLISYFQAPAPLAGPNADILRHLCFSLTKRFLLVENHAPALFLNWRLMGGFCKAYGSSPALQSLLNRVWSRDSGGLNASIEKAKSDIGRRILQTPLDAEKEIFGEIGYLTLLPLSLPEVGNILLTGSDYIDTLFEAYQIRKSEALKSAIVANIYVALSSLMSLSPPPISLLLDQLFNLKALAKVDTPGCKEANLLSDLICSTNFLKRLEKLASESSQKLAEMLVNSLQSYRKACSGMHLLRQRPTRKTKGKQPSTETDNADLHVHKMSLITQIQDLFPNLASGYVAKLLDFYSDEVETVVLHLVEDSLPAELKMLDQSEELSSSNIIPNIAPRPTPPPPEPTFTKKSVFDNDEFDRLEISTAKLHIGRANAELTADDILADRSSHSAKKAAILSALAAFDSDDDERDDTYDVADVGGTVDSMPQGAGIDADIGASKAQDNDTQSQLFKIYKSNPEVFGRDTATRRSQHRIALRKETGMTDEAIEGWAVMLTRDPKRMARMERDYTLSEGMSSLAQPELPSTSYRRPVMDGDEEYSSQRGESSGTRNPNDLPRGGRGRGRGRGRGGPRGNVAGPSGDNGTSMARRNKDANKSSRANHNRRDQRARKMARGGL